MTESTGTGVHAENQALGRTALELARSQGYTSDAFRRLLEERYPTLLDASRDDLYQHGQLVQLVRQLTPAAPDAHAPAAANQGSAPLTLDELVRRIAAEPPAYVLAVLAHVCRSLGEGRGQLTPAALVATLERAGAPLQELRGISAVEQATAGVELFHVMAALGRAAPDEDADADDLRRWGAMARHALRRHLGARGGCPHDLQASLFGRIPRYRGLVPEDGWPLLGGHLALWALDVANALMRDRSRVLFGLALVCQAARGDTDALSRGTPARSWDAEDLELSALAAYKPARELSQVVDPRLRPALRTEAARVGRPPEVVLEAEAMTAAVLALGSLVPLTMESPRGLPQAHGTWRRRLRRELERQLVPRRASPTVELAETLPDAAAERAFRRLEDRSELAGYLRRLSPMERQVIRLEFEDRLRREEIAQRLGASAVAVGLRRHRALAKLRDLALAAK